jgi:hypothetical protein
MRKKLVALSLLAAGGCGLVGACGPEAADCEKDSTCTCAGECVPALDKDASGYVGKMLFWEGDFDAEPPPCPAGFHVSSVSPLFDGLDPSPACGSCSCTEPKCQLPLQITALSSSCADPTATQSPFAAPEDWNGDCVATSPIPHELVRSIAFAATDEQPCSPVTAPPTKTDAAPRWARRIQVCSPDLRPSPCGDGSRRECLPPIDQETKQRFELCVAHPWSFDIPACPEPFLQKHVGYQTADTGSCSECRCIPSVPSVCEARVTAYEDTRCDDVITSGDATPSCVRTDFAASLGSMSAVWLTKAPGDCTAIGGEPSGERHPQGKTTFCCMRMDG